MFSSTICFCPAPKMYYKSDFCVARASLFTLETEASKQFSNRKIEIKKGKNGSSKVCMRHFDTVYF